MRGDDHGMKADAGRTEGACKSAGKAFTIKVMSAERVHSLWRFSTFSSSPRSVVVVVTW